MNNETKSKPICDRCLQEVDEVKPFPFLYMMAGHPQANEDGYVQFYGCTRCLQWEEDLSKAKRIRRLGL